MCLELLGGAVPCFGEITAPHAANVFMKKLIRLFFSGQFLAFLGAGALAALVNFLVRILLSRAGMEYSLAVALAYLAGMVVAFILFYKLVFRNNTNSLGRSLFGFVMVNLMGILLTVAVSSLLYYRVFPALDFAFYSGEIAHFLGISTTSVSSFIGHKFFSFREAGTAGTADPQ